MAESMAIVPNPSILEEASKVVGALSARRRHLRSRLTAARAA
jgi:hypothetical protein